MILRKTANVVDKNPDVAKTSKFRSRWPAV